MRPGEVERVRPQGRAPSWRVEAAFVLGFFGLLAIIATWPLAKHLGTVIPSDLGDPLLNAWILGWDAERLKHGLQGLWDAPIFYPYVRTLAFSEHLLGIAIWTAPLVWLRGGSPLVAYNVAIILSILLAGAGAYLLGRELTGRRDAALVSGVAFAFCQARIPQLSHIQMLWTGWTPLMLWALHRYFAGASRWTLAAFAFFWIEQTGSNLYTLYLSAVPVAAVVIHGLWRSGRLRWLRLGELAVTGAFMLATFAPVVVVYREVREQYGMRRSQEDVEQFGADLGAYGHGSLGIVPEVSVAPILFRQYAKPVGPEGELFPGLGILLLSAGGLATLLWRRGSFPLGTIYVASGLVAVLLSLGAAPAAWGRPLPIGALYRFLYTYAPGFDGLRVPGRFSAMVYLTLAVLAGGAVLWLPRGHPVTRAAIAGAVALVLLEGIPRSIPMPSVVELERGNRAAYQWIRDRAQGPMLELPIGDFEGGVLGHGYGYEYISLVHRQPIMNGRSGYNSAMQKFYGGPASPLAELERFGDSVRALRDLGIRTVTVHRPFFGDPALAASMVEALRSEREQVVEEVRFEGMHIFTLAASSAAERGPLRPLVPESALRRVAPSTMRLTANQDSERLPRILDSDLDTRWFSDGRQRGQEVVEIAFDRPRDIVRLRFETSERSTGDYPRDLQVESVGADGQTRTLFRGNTVRQLVDGIARDPVNAPIDLWLPPNQSARIVLRQLGTTRIWQWAIDELTAWEADRVK
jgi:hypothetical protein